MCFSRLPPIHRERKVPPRNLPCRRADSKRYAVPLRSLPMRRCRLPWMRRSIPPYRRRTRRQWRSGTVPDCSPTHRAAAEICGASSWIADTARHLPGSRSGFLQKKAISTRRRNVSSMRCRSKVAMAPGGYAPISSTTAIRTKRLKNPLRRSRRRTHSMPSGG